MNKEYHPLLRLFRWFRRIRHRQGYGVHSPFAFDLITNIIYNKESYYAYEKLSELLTLSGTDEISRLREKDLKLLFRLANFQEASRMFLVGASPVVRAYLLAARPKAQYSSSVNAAESKVLSDLFYYDSTKELPTEFKLPESALIIVRGIYSDKCSTDKWNNLKQSKDITITFDLWRFGLAFKRPKLQKQDYEINFF